MKIPKTFVPEKDLDKATDSLKFSKDNVDSLEDLIFHSTSPILDCAKRIGRGRLKMYYPYLDLDCLEDGMRVMYYGGATVDVLKFKNKDSAVYNSDQVYFWNNMGYTQRTFFLEGVEYDKRALLHRYVFVKGVYSVFVHTDIDSEKDNFVKFYKERLCFKEV